MKRSFSNLFFPFLLILAIFATVIPVEAVEIASRKIAVSNNGDLKFFSYGDIQKAIDSAAPNDTVFVPEGTFPAITIKEGIVLLGSGQGSAINGDITLAPSDTTLNAVIDGLKITGSIKASKPARGFAVRMCEMKNIFNDDPAYYDVIVERCNILGDLYQKSQHRNIIVYNSIVNRIYAIGEANNTYLYNNCKIDELLSSGNGAYPITGGFINSIVNNATAFLNKLVCIFQNCLVRKNPSSLNLIRDSWVVEKDDDWNRALNDLEAGGYIGTDGTIIGPDGGAFPYTLNPSLPTVKERKISVDYDNQTLNIELKLTGTPEGTPQNPD